MIARLRGTLLEKRPGSAVIETGGVGYEVTLTLGTYERLGEPGEPADLHIYTHVREEVLALFGFADRREKELEKDASTLPAAVLFHGRRYAPTMLSGTYPIGTRIGGFELRKVLGVGGMAPYFSA